MLMVRHLNKSHSGNAIYRGGGSIGIIGAARTGLLIGKHPEDESIRIAAPSKTNISKEAPSLTFTIHSESDDDPPKIIWGQETDVTADDMAKSPPDEDKRSALEDAKEFLLELLSSGPVEAEAVHAKARSREIKFATLRRAKKALKVESDKEGDAWFWRLPNGDDELDPGGGKEGVHKQKDGHLEHLPSKSC
jgi:hypothetical protein